jgi:hypothetical protein
MNRASFFKRLAAVIGGGYGLSKLDRSVGGPSAVPAPDGNVFEGGVAEGNEIGIRLGTTDTVFFDHSGNLWAVNKGGYSLISKQV